MKTLSPEASKKLQDKMPKETKYWYMENIFWDYVLWDEINMWTFNPKWNKYKTLTLSECFDLLWKACCYIEYIYPNWWLWNIRAEMLQDEDFKWETLLQAVEKMLLYLHDNNLLEK